jgi:hypothetical protein
VVVTHTIDDDLDLNTLQITSFGFGDTVVNVPAGRSNYFERVDVSATHSVVVDFEATVNPTIRELKITLTSLDPETLDFPIDPFAGFLPPNVTAPEGDGFIRFSIEPKADLAEGTVIDAVATIIFDVEDPILTPDVSNTIDNTAPNSEVTDFATNVPEEFTVSWTSEDGSGSGAASYDVYVSDNDGPFTLWLTTQEVSATYHGEVDHTYRFYSVATDGVGLVETDSNVAEAETTVLHLPWTNPANIYDVNGRDGTTVLDALVVIIELGDRKVSDPVTQLLDAVPPGGFAPPFFDVSMDGKVTAIDALQVINEIARELVILEGERLVAATSLDARSIFSQTLGDANLPEGLYQPRKISSFFDSSQSSALTTANEKQTEATLAPVIDEVFRHSTNWKTIDHNFDSAESQDTLTALLS